MLKMEALAGNGMPAGVQGELVVDGELMDIPTPDQDAVKKKKQKLLPVTVLSGFLGAGKTTLLKQILRLASGGSSAKAQKKERRRQRVEERDAGKAVLPTPPTTMAESMKVAVIVNDMGEINIDASELKHTKLIREDATMVEFQNGCICCTLRGDLLKTVKALSEENRFDYLVVESTGISEPLPVAQTFVMNVDAPDGGLKDKENLHPSSKSSLSNFARLDTLVTVVDALNVIDVLGSLQTLAEENQTGMVGNTGLKSEAGGDSEGEDDRSIAKLMLDQIEFASVIIVSKAPLVKMKSLNEITALLKKLNPVAKVIVPEKRHFADLALSDVLNTNLFDMRTAMASPGWLQELMLGEQHTPETEEYGISSLVFRNSERPFHAERLSKILSGFGNYATSISKGEQVKGNTFLGVVRSKGQLWIATSNAYPIDLHTAGRTLELKPNPRCYVAALPREEWGEDVRKLHEQLERDGKWSPSPVVGDRESEAVFIGVRLDKTKMRTALEGALLTDEELIAGPETWKSYVDPFFGGGFMDRLVEGDEDGDTLETSSQPEDERADESDESPDDT